MTNFPAIRARSTARSISGVACAMLFATLAPAFDAHADDAGVPDAHADDAGVPDAHADDAGIPDAHADDAGVPDAHADDAGVLEAGEMGDVREAGDGEAASARQPSNAEGPLAEASAEGLSDEDRALLASLEEGASLRTGTGVVGVVTDRESGEPLIEAQVHVVGRREQVVTDLDGRFAIDLPPGRYTLRSFYALYAPMRAENVVVTPNEASEVELALAPETNATEREVVVTARADTSTAAAQLERRRRSANVQDGISAEEIARTPDSTADDSARRVVGASIVDGRYLYVRGLGGRYTNVLLNGVTVPSTDPDVQSVQLDLFPATLLDGLTVAKTFTPDLPADFAGGSLLISTRDFPDALRVQTTLGLGLNTETTFRGVLDHDGGALDFLGIDDGSRALPAAVPERRVRIERNGLGRDEVDSIARSFPSRWNVYRSSALPDLTAGISVGNTLRLGSRPLGFLVSATYGLARRRTAGGIVSRLTIASADGTPQLLPTPIEETSTEEARLGALASATLGLTSTSDLSLVVLGAHNGADQVSVYRGRSESEGATVFRRQLQFVERSLLFGQLLGEHRELGLLRGAKLEWQLNGSVGRRDEPDTRDLLYEDFGQGFQWRDAPGSGERFFSELDQSDLGGGFSLSLPVSAFTAKLGALGRHTERRFGARRFGYDFRCCTDADKRVSPELLFGPASVGPNVSFKEVTRDDEGYDAGQDLIAAYAMVELPLGPVRVVGGVRAESFRQTLETHSPFVELANAADPASVRRTDVDVLPALAAVLPFSETIQVRAAYGATVARPQLRELSLVPFPDYVRRRVVTGNPELERTYVHNFDLRLEAFPGTGEVVAASVFAKSFEHPIETVIPDDQQISYANVDGASNFGAELEAKTNLGRLFPALSSLVLGANVAVIRSRVRLSDEQRLRATNSERPLAGQSPFVANLSLGFIPDGSGLSAYVYYNVFGRRLAEVGLAPLPDVYEEPFHSLDVSVAYAFDEHVTARITAQNLLFQRRERTQGAFVVDRDVQGMSAALRLQLRH